MISLDYAVERRTHCGFDNKIALDQLVQGRLKQFKAMLITVITTTVGNQSSEQEHNLFPVTIHWESSENKNSFSEFITDFLC